MSWPHSASRATRCRSAGCSHASVSFFKSSGQRPLMVRVLHIIGEAEPGGAQEMFLSTTLALIEKGRQEHIGRGISKRMTLLEGKNTKITSLGAPRSSFYPLRALGKIIDIPLIALCILHEKPD